MKVDRRELICGIRPAILKRLLRRGYEGFDTPTAMQVLEVNEPAITTTLLALQEGEWVSFLSTRKGVDWWRPGAKGQRLLATVLLRRIPRAQAQEIFRQLIEEVRAINADSEISLRIKQVMLFGSLLTGASEDMVGDVDVVVTTQRRALPQAQLRALEKEERADAPSSVRYRESALLGWPETRLRRRLRISPYLSFHPVGDLLPGSVHQEVYAYDIEHECEMSPDRELRTRTRLVPFNADLESIANTPYARASRHWPSAPKRGMVIELHGDNARLAQHLWMNGEGIRAIGARIHSRPSSVQTYLASRAELPTEPRRGLFHASLKETVLEALPCERNCHVLVRLGQSPSSEVTIDIEVLGLKGERADLRRIGRDYFIRQSPLGFINVLEAADRAAAAWHERARPSLRGLGIEIAFACSPS